MPHRSPKHLRPCHLVSRIQGHTEPPAALSDDDAPRRAFTEPALRSERRTTVTDAASNPAHDEPCGPPLPALGPQLLVVKDRLHRQRPSAPTPADHADNESDEAPEPLTFTTAPPTFAHSARLSTTAETHALTVAKPLPADYSTRHTATIEPCLWALPVDGGGNARPETYGWSSDSDFMCLPRPAENSNIPPRPTYDNPTMTCASAGSVDHGPVIMAVHSSDEQRWRARAAALVAECRQACRLAMEAACCTNVAS